MFIKTDVNVDPSVHHHPVTLLQISGFSLCDLKVKCRLQMETQLQLHTFGKPQRAETLVETWTEPLSVSLSCLSVCLSLLSSQSDHAVCGRHEWSYKP